MGRRDEEGGTALKLGKHATIALAKKFPQYKPLCEDWRFNNNAQYKVSISMRRMSLEAVQFLSDLYEEGDPDEDRNRQLLYSFLPVMKNPQGAVLKKLRPLEHAILKWVSAKLLRAWVFRNGPNGMEPWLVTNVRYFPPDNRKDYQVPAHVNMYLSAFGRDTQQTDTISWHIEDIEGKNVEQCLLDKGIFRETKELIAAYDKLEDQFLKWRTMLGEQFVGDGEHQVDGGDRWSTKSHTLHGAKMVVNDKCKEIKNRVESNLFILGSDEDDDEREEDDDAREGPRYTRMPLQPYIWMYDLSAYQEGWVHMSALKLYVYKPELREKLILPEEHGDLIDALTADMDVLMEDIISGKSGGTTILCQGKAGTGKTLTAEVYSEIVKRPLYRVHSGQLGTDAESVEEALKAALERSKRWRAVLLIDEADVFVSQRGGDLEKNAVISVFLRVLEYYDGLLFLTTNRRDDIDEAILSRCIAQIKYDVPNVNERERLWMTLGDVFGMPLVKDKPLAKRLAAEFECTGRDIKGLIKLVTKYARQRGKKPAFEDFKRMAAFRGM